MAPQDSPRRSNRRPRPRHGESPRNSPRKHGQSGQKRRSHTRRPATASDDAGEDRGSHSLSSGALAQLNKEHAKRKKTPDRRRSSYRPVDRIVEQEHIRPRKKPRHKKKRVVSGAIMEEGRARRHGRHWSDESFEKEEYYHKPPSKWKNKKLCKTRP